MEHEHCKGYEVPKRPPGCVCDVGDWVTHPIPPVCDKYRGDPEELCDNCEHEFACHQQTEQR